jgi:hypothetical protein
MFDIRRYNPSLADAWNQFVARSKNGTFLIDRNYMDYHQDRFEDCSLVFFRKNRIYALLPANIVGNTLYSHQGLTYGGLIMDEHCTGSMVFQLFTELNAFLVQMGIKHVEYKPTPSIYHVIPAEEDLYALYHVCKARMVARDYSTNIFLRAGLRWERVRRRGVVRAQKAGLTVRRSDHYADFWKVLSDNLGNKYGIKPVHSLQEIELLRSRFPENIILYEAVKDGQVIAGVVLYLSSQVVHAQYSSATPEGKSLGAIDLIYEQIMLHDYVNYPYFDFGRSTENPDGSGLNESLAFQKEGFGGRGLCYDIYEYDL